MTLKMFRLYSTDDGWNSISNWNLGFFLIRIVFHLLILIKFFFFLSLADLVKRLSDYEVVVPRKVSEQGQLLSHHLTHHYDDASRRQRRRRRQVDDNDDHVHYRLELSGREKQLHLKPNDRLLASSFIVERRHGRNVTNHRLTPARHQQCHYMGRVKGHPESTVAVSTCNGLVSRLFHISHPWSNIHPNGSYAIVCIPPLWRLAPIQSQPFVPLQTNDRCPSRDGFSNRFSWVIISLFRRRRNRLCRRTLKSKRFWAESNESCYKKGFLFFIKRPRGLGRRSAMVNRMAE